MQPPCAPGRAPATRGITGLELDLDEPNSNVFGGKKGKKKKKDGAGTAVAPCRQNIHLAGRYGHHA